MAGKWTYLYRAVDSAGATIKSLLSAGRAAAAKCLIWKALQSPGHPRRRVINVTGNPSYPWAVTELKACSENSAVVAFVHQSDISTVSSNSITEP